MKILVGYDGSESAKKAVEQAKKLTSTCEIFEILILHVLEDPISEGGQYFDAVDMDRLEETKEQFFGKDIEAQKEGFTNSNVQTKIIKGVPEKVIADYAKEEGYDLIVMGSRGRSGIKKWIPGSVSSAVVNNCCVTVMVVK